MTADSLIVSPAASDPVSQTIKVFGEISGAAPELMAGMSGRANIAAPN